MPSAAVPPASTWPTRSASARSTAPSPRTCSTRASAASFSISKRPGTAFPSTSSTMAKSPRWPVPWPSTTMLSSASPSAALLPPATSPRRATSPPGLTSSPSSPSTTAKTRPSTNGPAIPASARPTFPIRPSARGLAPVASREAAPSDEWAGDPGVGAQYFSQQAVGRLLAPAGIDLPKEMTLPLKLEIVQQLMAGGDPRARKIYRTIGVYFGYNIATYADFYDVRNLLVLGRVLTGAGGDLILSTATEVLTGEFPEVAERIRYHIPDEKEKRHGQAIAAASLPSIPTLETH